MQLLHTARRQVDVQLQRCTRVKAGLDAARQADPAQGGRLLERAEAA